jgi:predicted nucleic acid-binding protein
MGLIADTSILIAGERRGDSLAEILHPVPRAYPAAQVAISAITLVELDHGLYRARSERDRTRRRIFTDEVATDLVCYPVDREVARIAGRIEGQLASAGFAIGLAGLLIGCTALHLGDSVLTFNTKHFTLLPNLTVLTL